MRQNEYHLTYLNNRQSEGRKLDSWLGETQSQRGSVAGARIETGAG